MPRFSARVLAVLSAGAIAGVACALAPPLHARPAAQGPADGPAPMELDPDFYRPSVASHRIDIAFLTMTGKTPAGRAILTRDAAGCLVLDVKRQGYNNLKMDCAHRALVQFFPAVPRGQRRAGADLVPLHEFELPPMTLRPGGVDNFNVASREGFVVPPGDYSLVIATAAPAGPNLPPERRFIEKNPHGFWMDCSGARYEVSVR